jgi:hypothetical protein
MPRVLEFADSCSSRTCSCLLVSSTKSSEAMEVPLRVLEFQEDGKLKATNGRKVRPNCIQILVEIGWGLKSSSRLGVGKSRRRHHVRQMHLAHSLNDFASGWKQTDVCSVARDDMHLGI